MTKIVLFLVLFSASLAESSTRFPVKSHLCLAAFAVNQSNLNGKVSSENTYTLNSVSAIINELLKVKTPRPNNSEGLFLSNTIPSKSEFNQVAGRLKGIEEFSKKSVNTDLGKKLHTSAVSIVGKEKIKNFLRSYGEMVDIQAQHVSSDIFNKFKIITGLNLFLLANIGPGAFTIENPLLIQGLIGFSGLQLLWQQDFIYKRPMYWDYSFLRNLDKLESSLAEVEFNSLAVLSKNFNLDEVSINNILNNFSTEDQLLGISISQTYKEALPLRAKLEALARKIKYQPEWVGVDFILENKLNQEPELHLVVRTSEKMPIYPKRVKQRQYSNDVSFEPILVPLPVKK